MIVDERIITFINSMDTENSEILETIEQEALAADVPIIRREMQSFLEVLLLMKKPMRVLEVGTAVGFSALLMSDYLPEGGHITTIENYPPRIEQAKQNIMRAGAQDKITLLEGDAHEILPQLDDEYDMVFMDAAKGQYGSFFDESIEKLKSGGILLCDNVLQDGDVLESRFAVTRRNRTIHARMREYLYSLTHDERLETGIFNIGDGMSLSIKK